MEKFNLGPNAIVNLYPAQAFLETESKIQGSDFQFLTAHTNSFKSKCKIKNQSIITKISDRKQPVNLRLLDVMRNSDCVYAPEFDLDFQQCKSFSEVFYRVEAKVVKDYTIFRVLNYPEPLADSTFVYARKPNSLLIDMSSVFDAIEENTIEFYSVDKKPVIYYHHNCMDGLGSKYAAWLRFQDTAEYRPFSYGVTDILAEGVELKDVYFLDCSLPAKDVFHVCDTAARVTVIDHHISAKKSYDHIKIPNNMKCLFDMDHSGAILAWKYFFRDVKPPHVLELIEDRDLWKFSYEETNLLYYAQQSKPSINEIDIHRLAKDSLSLRTILEEGKSVKSFVDVQIEDALPHHIPITLDRYTVPAFNCMRVIASDVLNTYLDRNKDVKFAASYQDVDGLRRWSLRSRGDFDVSVIASSFGGGGHAGAAGFVTNITNPLK